MKKRTLSRRTVLRGAGVAIALPFLEAMLPGSRKAQAQSAQEGVRVLFIYKPNGQVNGAYNAVNGEPGGIYAPFAAHKNYVSAINNLRQPPDGVDYADGHAPGIGRYLTGGQFNPSLTDIRNVRSLDWIIADARNRSPHFLASNEFIRIGHSVLSDEYFNYVSWRGPRAASPTVDPRAFFTTLFGSIQTDPDATLKERTRLNRRSVLDFIKGEANRVIASVGKDDKIKIDEYLEGIRQAEKAAEQTGGEMAVCKADTGMPVTPQNYEQWATVMLDLVYRSLLCDPKQLITMQFAPEVGFPQILGLSGMHNISHYNENAASYKSPSGLSKKDDYIKVCTWYAQKVADLAGRMKATIEPDGKNLLDKSVLLYGAGLGDSDQHTWQNPASVLIGRANGGLSPQGQYINGNGARHANLLLKIAQVAGLPLTKFGTSTGVLSGI